MVCFKMLQQLHTKKGRYCGLSTYIKQMCYSPIAAATDADSLL